MEIINILWTGGLDSTYRVSELCVKWSGIIQPYYIKAKERNSAEYELNAIHKITGILRESFCTKAVLKDVIVIEESSILPDDNIKKARQVLSDKYALGSQYDFIARFLKQKRIEAEVGVMFTDRGKVSKCIGNADNRLIKFRENGVSYYKTNPDVVSVESQAIFGNMRFPSSLMNKTKVEEREGLLALGLEEVYKSTWFCHTPVRGLPCGRCNPCKDAIAEGMPERVPLNGRLLGLIRAMHHRIINLFKK